MIISVQQLHIEKRNSAVVKAVEHKLLQQQNNYKCVAKHLNEWSKGRILYITETSNSITLREACQAWHEVLFPDVNTALKVRQVFPTNGAVAERGFLLN